MNKRDGFTLIEVIIFIAIIGVLAAIVLQFWNGHNDQIETLKVKDWQCLKTERRSYPYPTMVGKVPIITHGTREECVEWLKRSAG